MSNATKTLVSGTVTFESEKDGAIRTVRFPSFEATPETPYVDLVDRAIERAESKLPKLPAEFGWIQIDEAIEEAVR